MAPEDVHIRICVSNGSGFVFTAEEVYKLRAKYNITGTLIGTLPSASQQNIFLGLPLLLLPEEVVLLVETGAALLIDDIIAHNISPSLDQLTTWHSSKTIDARDRIGGSQSPASGPETISAKQAGREATRFAHAVAASSTAPGDPIGPDPTEEPPPADNFSLFAPEEPVAVVSASSTPIPMPSPFVKPRSVTVPAASSVLPWYPSSDKRSAFATASPVTASLLQHQHEYKTLESARKAGLWAYPSTQAERARCAVFRDLHEKGYWMGGGLKFGGDWLVYPSDPLRYHSHFVATVYPTPTSTIRPMEIVALGRLGTATKKSHLLCGWDEATGKVDYYSIEWAGF